MFRVFILLLFAICLVCSSKAGYAFDVDGFHSGMTTEQLGTVAKNRGLEAWEIQQGVWGIGKQKKYQINGTFTFCSEEGLVLYNHNIDFDVDYVPALQSFLEKNGQPQRVSNIRIPIEGNEAQTSPSVVMAWYKNNDRITLSFSPELRDGHGQLRFERYASVQYVAKNSCLKNY